MTDDGLSLRKMTFKGVAYNDDYLVVWRGNERRSRGAEHSAARPASPEPTASRLEGLAF